jgi:chromosome segregation ATPase
VSDNLEERVDKLAEAIEKILEQLEVLSDSVDKLNKNRMADTYRRLVEEDRLEEMREKHPERIDQLEQTAQQHLGDKIEELEKEVKDLDSKTGEGGSE